MQHPKPGPNFVPEYQVSGLPFVLTGSGTRNIQFPYATQWIMCKSTGGSFYTGFSTSSFATGYCFLVPSSGSVGPLTLRVRDLFISGSGNWEIIAGLTMIEYKMFPLLTASAAAGVFPPYSSSFAFGYVPGL